MGDRIRSGRDGKKIDILKNCKGQEAVENHDHPHPESTCPIEEKRSFELRNII